MFDVVINDVNVRSEENTTPEVFENVKVYAGDPWYEPVDGKLRNIRIMTSKA